ncbi:MAG: integration host factor subunit beta [Betaproteobacteria bacterium]|nr:integration host factor subunit beta [Betaproteobacteria bacterium]NBT75803.1 integration host factor subunit beta [Betaproteobacteria bacterium]NBY14198.1 integration host factor subunit beta [Betaproteobacteria bacterium]NCA16470.1 integration host factor subunit beta [Betaproteobacteria bacterium]
MVRLTERLNNPVLGVNAQLGMKDCEVSVRLLLEAMAQALMDGHRIEIRGFGTFSVSSRPPRMGRNPKSGEEVSVPAKRVPHFKPGKELRVRVNRNA